MTDTARSMILTKTNAEKYSFCSFPSDILLTAAPPNPPSPTRLKIPRYAIKRKYAPRVGPNTWAKYIVEIETKRCQSDSRRQGNQALSLD